MPPSGVVEVPQWMNAAPPVRAIKHVAMLISANTRPKIEGGGREDAAREDALQVGPVLI